MRVVRQGKIWAGTWSNGLNLWDPQSNTFTHVGNEITSELDLAIEEDQQGNIWFRSAQTMDCLDLIRRQKYLETR